MITYYCKRIAFFTKEQPVPRIGELILVGNDEYKVKYVRYEYSVDNPNYDHEKMICEEVELQNIRIGLEKVTKE